MARQSHRAAAEPILAGKGGVYERMNQGWISLHRQIKGHWLYDDKPFDRYHAWTDILLSVNHADAKVLFDGQLILVKAGQMITSLSKLTEKWGWESRSKTRRFLELLVSDGMVELRRNKNGTLLTVANWGKHQSAETQTEHSRNTHETITDTNNNVNNANNTLLSQLDGVEIGDDRSSKKKKSVAKTFSADSVEYKAAAYMATKIPKHTPNFPQLRESKREATIQRWAADIDKLLRIDEVDINEFKAVLQFSQTDPFWQINIMSGKKLREQYGILLAKMNKEGNL